MKFVRTIHPLFSDKHKDYMQRAKNATICVAEGAVRAGKTIDNIWLFANELIKGTPDKIHLATGSSTSNAKMNIGDSNGFGLEHIFAGRCKWGKYKGNEALKINLNGREYVVIFAGATLANSFKKIRGNSYGMWIATEINLHHDDTIKEAFNRQLASKNRKIFWDLNPVAPAHFIYADYIDRFAEAYGDRYCYEHFTIRDNATISEERYQEIVRQYEIGSIWYRRDILGERCAPEGLVYQSFDKAKHCYDIAPWENAPVQPYEARYIVSIDYGTANPFAMAMFRIYHDKAYMVKEYYYDGRRQRVQKTDEDYYNDLDMFCAGYDIDMVIVDPSALSFITTIRKHSKYSVRHAVNDVLDGIRITNTMMMQGKLLFNRNLKATFDEFGLYSWNDKSTEDAVIKEYDHMCDAIRYFVMTVGRRRIRITE